MVGGPRPAQLVSEADTLPSLREQEHDDDDNNTSPSDDNVFESPAATLETRAQVSGNTENQASWDSHVPFWSQWEDSDSDSDSCSMQKFPIGSDSDSDPLIEM